MSFYHIARRLLFSLPPERAHALSLHALRLAGATSVGRSVLRQTFLPRHQNAVDVCGLTFANPIGLAAGYDKDGLAWRALACLGFGHIEVGTVTLRPQPGNPKPRVFRLPQQHALINRMGFPGHGATVVAKRLSGSRPAGLILGVNLGKNKDTPLDSAVDDYTALVEIFAPLADYLAINVSSPNTEGLRQLQAKQALQALLSALVDKRDAQMRRPPLFVKLAPDLDAAQLDDAVQTIIDCGVDGIIATNTTLSRHGLEQRWHNVNGGLSGAPLMQRSTDILEAVQHRCQGRLPIIAVGGVMTAADVKAKFDAGASLVQVYTGLVYQGPGMVREILAATDSVPQA